MTVALALITAAANLVAGGYGALRWYRVEPDRAFWLLLRAAQAVAVAFALYAGGSWLLGDRSLSGDLFELYALLPVAVAFVAEQLRLVSAQTVMDARGIEDAQAVGELPEAEQRKTTQGAFEPMAGGSRPTRSRSVITKAWWTRSQTPSRCQRRR